MNKLEKNGLFFVDRELPWQSCIWILFSAESLLYLHLWWGAPFSWPVTVHMRTVAVTRASEVLLCPGNTLLCFVNNLNSLGIVFLKFYRAQVLFMWGMNFSSLEYSLLSFQKVLSDPGFTGSSRTANIDRDFLVLASSVSRIQWMTQLLKICTFILTIITLRKGLVGSKFCLNVLLSGKLWQTTLCACAKAWEWLRLKEITHLPTRSVQPHGEEMHKVQVFSFQLM